MSITDSTDTVLSAGIWQLDPAHSSVRWRVVVPAMGGVVNGRFDDISATMDVDADGTSSIAGRASTASVDTGVSQRDEHLRSPEFFDAARFPQVTFTASGRPGNVPGLYVAAGRLDLHGVQADLVLGFEVLAAGIAADGSEKVAMAATERLDRHSFGFDMGERDAGMASTVEFAIDVSLVKDA